MAPAHAGGRMGGCETTPPDPRARRTTQRPPPATPTQQALLASNHRPPLASVKLVRPRPRPDGRYRCGRSSLTPDRRGGTGTSSYEETQHNSQPGDYQVTGSRQHALFDSEGPHGRLICAPQPRDAEALKEQIIGVMRPKCPAVTWLCVHVR